jgi:Ca2+-binding EF-hand superfamily protein
MRTAAALAALLLTASLAPAGPPGPEAQDVVLMSDSRPYLIRLSVFVDGRPFGARFDVHLLRWFAYLDRNGDGALDKDEAAHAPSVQQLAAQLGGGRFGIGQTFPAPPFRDLDANGDGKVTSEEFVAYYRRAGFGPLMLGDANVGVNPSASAGEVLFRALDTNGDGKLSRAEVERAAEVLRQFDQNDDEILTAAELSNAPGAGGLRVAQVPGGLAVTPLKSSGPLVLVAQDDAGRLDAAKTILARYDKNGDGFLSRDEIRLPDELFAKLDRVRAGKLKAGDLAAWLAMPVDAALVLRLGKVDRDLAPVEGLANEPEKTGLKVEKTDDGVLALKLADLRVQVRRGDGNGAANFGLRIRQVYVQVFKASDNGNKGFVTTEDVKTGQAQAFLGPIFAAADHDGDGKLTEKELNDYLDLLDGVPAGLTGLSVMEQSNGLFELLDADRDGRLSVRELRNAWKRLADLDPENTGFVTRGSIPRQVQLTLNPGPPNFNGLVLGRPVLVQPGRNADPRRAAPAARGPLWFRKMDLNGDGDISPREWLGSPELFRKIDEDGDGLISLDEAERYERRKQAEQDRK